MYLNQKLNIGIYLKVECLFQSGKANTHLCKWGVISLMAAQVLAVNKTL